MRTTCPHAYHDGVRRRALLALLLTCCGAPATAPATVRIPVGDARLDIGETAVDVPGLRNGADACYTQALRASPAQQGEIAFEVKPPHPVALKPHGAIGRELLACIEHVFGGYSLHSAVAGTLHFTPRWIVAPAPPPAEVARAALDRSYRPGDVVRITRVVLKSVSEQSDPTSPQVRRIYNYDIELVFRSAAYESVCQHWGSYKVFGRRPFDPVAAGHTCEHYPRNAGDRVVDSAMVIFSLTYYPDVATRWEPD